MFVVWPGHEFVAREFFTIQVHFHHVANIICGNFIPDLKIEMAVAVLDSVQSENSDESGRIRIRCGRIRVRGEPKWGDWARKDRRCQIDLVVVRWPGQDGLTQEWTGLVTGRTYRLIEGDPQPHLCKAERLRPSVRNGSIRD